MSNERLLKHAKQMLKDGDLCKWSDAHDTAVIEAIDAALYASPSQPVAAEGVREWSGRIIEIDYETHRAVVRYEGNHPEIGMDVSLSGSAESKEADRG